MVDKVAGLSLDVDVSQVDRAVKSLNQFATANDKAADATHEFLNQTEIAKQKAKAHANELAKQTREYSAIQKAIDPTINKMNQLRETAKSLDSLWQKGFIPDDEFFRLSSILEQQENSLKKNKLALTEEGKAAIEESRAKERASAAADKFLRQLQDQAAAAGKTSAEMMELKAAQLGVSQQAAPFIAQLNAQSKGMKLAGLSAGQYSQAMRMLPAQITDVVTSLASGMPVWLVAIQQGGQIKDSFGGIGNTFKVLTSYITPMRIALAGTVGVLLGLGKAAWDSYEANKALSDSLILTGNYAGKTTGEIRAMSESIAEGTQATVSTVQQIATDLVKSGKYTGEQIKIITAATAQWAAVTGDSAQEVTGYFKEIAGDPVQGLAKLNEQFNFLEKGQLTYIASLEKTQGKTAAVTAATKLFADTMETRLQKIADSATPLEKMWDNIKKWASSAWGWVGDHTRGALNLIIDVVAGTVEQVQLILNKGDIIIGQFIVSATKSMQKIPGMGDVGNDVIKQQEKVINDAIANNKELEKSIIERDKRIRQGEMGYINSEGKENLGKKYADETKAAVEKEAEALKKKNKEQKVTVEQGDRITEQYNADIIALQSQLQVLKEHKTINDSISQQRKTLWNEQAKVKVLEEAATQRVLTKEEKSYLANKDKILALAEQKAILGDQIVAQQKLNSLQDESTKFVLKMEAQSKSLRDTSGLGDIAAKRKQELEQLKASWKAKGGDEEDPALKRMIDAREKFYADEDAKRQDWLSGAEAAFNNYGEAATNMYDNVGQVASEALNGMSTMMADFLMTGKANFADFAKSIISMIINMITKMVLFNSIAGLMGGNTWSFAGGMGGFANGGYTGDGGKYEPKGVVHGGEFVFTKEATSRIGVGNLNKLMRGYANGGSVGNASRGTGLTLTSSSGQGTYVDVSGMQVDVNNGNDPLGMEQGIRMIFNEMINDACSQGGKVYNYINEKTGG